MQKHSSHVIDHKAVQIFKGALPPEHWTVYDIQPDYGKDHKVELVEDGKLTGQSFWVQIKGQSKVRPLRDGTISFKLETKDLDYYTKLPAPVFLIVVDVARRVGYWVFIQEYERTQLKNVQWRSQSYIQIRLPETNKLSDDRSMRHAVRNAIRYMAMMSLKEGVMCAEEQLSRLDPRCDVKVSATAKGEIVEVSPHEELRIDLEFGADFCESGKLKNLVGRGLPVQVKPGDIAVEGSLLIRSILNDTAERHGFVQLSVHGLGHVRLTYLDPQGSEYGRSHEFECHYEGGLEEVRYQARTTYGTLAIKGACPSSPDVPSRIDIAFDPSCWVGKMVSSLPNIDLMSDLLGHVEEGGRMNVELFVEGAQIVSGYMLWNQSEMESIGEFLVLIELISKARWITRTFGVNATLPREITREHVQEIMKLYRLAQGEEIRLKGAIHSASARLSRINKHNFENMINHGDDLIRLAYVSDRPLPFLGFDVYLGPVETQMTRMRLDGDRETINRQIQEGMTPIPLTWIATAETELIIKRATEERLSSCETAEKAQEHMK